MAAKLEECGVQAETGETWSVAVIYEDSLTRDRAMSLCDDLVQQFWAEVGFEISWWRESYLADSTIAAAAAAAATNADLIVFSTHAAGELSDRITAWAETWLDKRGGRDGALIGLIGTPEDPETDAVIKLCHLRQVAERGKLDYLSSVLPMKPQVIAGSIESIHRRAAQVTSVLDKILKYPPTDESPPWRTFEV